MPISTWFKRISDKPLLFGFVKAAKASFVGANTVNGPAPCNVVTKFSEDNAPVNEVKLSLFNAWSTMSGKPITASTI